MFAILQDKEIKNFLHEAKYKFQLLNENFTGIWSVGSYVSNLKCTNRWCGVKLVDKIGN